MAYVLVFVGTALGGMARYGLSGIAARLFGATFPWGTLIVNVSGSLLIGALAALGARDGALMAGTDARLFAIVGLCGGYTTVSSFSLQTLTLALEDEWLRAGLNIVASVALCLLAAGFGYWAALAAMH